MRKEITMRKMMLAGAAALLVLAMPGHAQTAPVPSDKATPAVTRLLKLMDKDKSGNVSRQEFLDFMAAECDRLDTDHSGELNVAELSGLKVVARSHPGGSGK